MMAAAAHPVLQRYTFAMQVVGVPALAGIAYLVIADAPTNFAVVNGAALAAALFIAVVVPALASAAPFPNELAIRRAIAAILLAGLAWPLIAGPEVYGVSRWIAAGGFTLHSGMLLIPPLIVLAVRDHRAAPIILLAATLACFAQPDSASCLALSLAALVQGFWQRRSLIIGLGLLAAFASIGASFNGAVPPQPFVENILPELWAVAPFRAAALAISLAVPIIFLVLTYRKATCEGLVVAGALTGFIAAAVLSDYPFPLIGYGAAPILGLGIAIAAFSRSVFAAGPQDEEFTSFDD